MAVDNENNDENLNESQGEFSKNSNPGDSNADLNESKKKDNKNTNSQNNKENSSSSNEENKNPNNDFNNFFQNDMFDFSKNFQEMNGASGINPDMFAQMMKNPNMFSNLATIFSNEQNNQYINKTILLDTFNSNFPSSGREEVKYDEMHEASSLMAGGDLWIDSYTNFFSRAKEKSIKKPIEAFRASVDGYIDFATPISKRIISGLLDNFNGDGLMPNVGIAIVNEQGDVSNNELSRGLINQLIQKIVSISFAKKLGLILSKIYKNLLGMNTLSIPLSDKHDSALLLENIKKSSKENSIEYKNLLKFVSILEMSYSRLFHNVKWLKIYIITLLEKYSKLIDVSIDDFMKKIIQYMEDNEINPSDNNAMGFGIDIMSLLNDKNENVKKNNNPSFPDLNLDDNFDLSIFVFQTDESVEILNRIETVFTLIQGWVFSVAIKASMTNIENINELYEYCTKKNLFVENFKNILSAFTLTDFKEINMKKSIHFWDVLLKNKSLEYVDSLWGHPDNLPSLEDILDPDRFIKFGKGSDVLDSLNDEINWDSEFESLLNPNKENDKKNDKDDNESSGEVNGEK